MCTNRLVRLAQRVSKRIVIDDRHYINVQDSLELALHNTNTMITLTKTCKRCNTSFDTKYAIQIYCDRKCARKDYNARGKYYHNAWMKKHKQEYWIIYRLKCNKIGLTKCLYTRLANHKRLGRDVSDPQHLSKAYSYVEAKDLEYLYQVKYNAIIDEPNRVLTHTKTLK